MTADLQQEKQALRQAARHRREAAARRAAGGAPERLLETLRAAIGLPPGAAVSGYWPIGTEVDPRPLLTALHDSGHPIGLPVVLGPARPLMFRTWRPGLELEKVSFGLWQPPAEHPVLVPQVLLVPLLAFDRRGYRLGYGGGFYDRTLAGLRAAAPETLAVGLAYAGQEAESVPAEATDQPLDWIITESEAIEVGRQCASSSAATS